MSRIAWKGLTLSILFLALPHTASAQDAAAVLQPAAEALRVGDVDELSFVASGSGYEARPEEEPAPRARPAPSAEGRAEAPEASEAVADPAHAEPSATPSAAATAGRSDAVDPSSPLYVPPPAPRSRRYFRIVSQLEELNLAEGSLRIEQVRTGPSADRGQQAPVTTTIGPDSSWTKRHRYWLTPHAFVAGALSHEASVETETLDGIEYRVVTFTVDGGHEIRGYVDENDRLVRVRTTVSSEDGEATDVVESFFEWAEQGDVTFPTTLIRKENGELAEVLVVQEIDLGAPG